jgi:hypothetical protein
MRKEVIDLMKQGALEICDRAIDLHWQGKYGPPNQKLIEDWKKRRAEVVELASELRRGAE